MTKATEILNSGFDINSMDVCADSAVGFEFEVVHPVTAKGLGAFFTVVGDESDIVRNHIRTKLAELRNLQMQAKRRGTEYESTLDDLERDATESAAVRVIGGRGWMENGQPLVLTPDSIKAMLNKHKWMRQQIMSKSGDLGNFTK